MTCEIVQLRRHINEPGEFLDWLILTRGWTQRAAALLVADDSSPRTQYLLREWETDRVSA